MKKNGFTLVELLAVIAILVIIALIAIPAIQRVIKDSREKSYQAQIDYIESSLELWGVDNPYSLPENEGGTVSMTLGDLKAAGYIKDNITNPLTDEAFPNNTRLIITRINNQYTYAVDM